METALTASQLRSVLAGALEGSAARLRHEDRRHESLSEAVVEGTGIAPPGRLAFSISEAAQPLGVGRSSIYAAIQAGALLVLRMGRRTLIPTGALADWVTERAHVSS